MKFNISEPPKGGGNTGERLDRLVSWLTLLSENLNVVLSNLGEDNFSQEAAKTLFEKKGKVNSDDT